MYCTFDSYIDPTKSLGLYNCTNDQIQLDDESTLCWTASASTHHVSRSVSEAPGLLVLAGQDEGPQPGLVDPVDPPDDLQRCQHPPGVAHVWKLPPK